MIDLFPNWTLPHYGANPLVWNQRWATSSQRGSTWLCPPIYRAGAMASLRKEDYITSTHRGHWHMTAKGADLGKTMSELYGKVTGYCRGKAESMQHFYYQYRPSHNL